MVRTLVCATVSAALCFLSTAPAMAQDYRFTGFDAPRGATATLNFRVPLGRQARQARPTYGLTFGYGQPVPGQNVDGLTATRGVTLADFRFSGRELRNARVASFDLANLDRDRRVNNLNGSVSTVWIIVGVAAAVVGGCLIAGCFGGDDDAMPVN